MIVAVNSGLGVNERAPAISHQCQCVMRRIAQPSRLQLFTQKPAEHQAAGPVGVRIRDENRIAGEAVVEVMLLPVVLPRLQQIVGHRIVVDGNEKIRRHPVGAERPLEQAERRPFARDQESGLVEARIDKRLVQVLAQLQIERVFGNATRAHRARHLHGVADIDDDPEIRTPASGRRRFRCGGVILAARRICVGAKEDSEGGEERRRGVAKRDHDPSLLHDLPPMKICRR